MNYSDLKDCKDALIQRLGDDKVSIALVDKLLRINNSIHRDETLQMREALSNLQVKLSNYSSEVKELKLLSGNKYSPRKNYKTSFYHNHTLQCVVFTRNSSQSLAQAEAQRVIESKFPNVRTFRKETVSKGITQRSYLEELNTFTNDIIFTGNSWTFSRS